MESVVQPIEKNLKEAVPLWTGWEQNVMPQRDDASVVSHFGDLAPDLLRRIKELEDDFYASDARFTASTLQEMGRIASDQFRQRHQKIADEIVRAFAWCYTFDYK
jgi:hypothetical protein